jgi:MFS family permease
MTLWFSAAAVTPALAIEWHLDEAGKAWLVMAVQLGFVCGTLISALFNLADIFNARRLFALCAGFGAGCNAAIALWPQSIASALVLRFLTGVCLAGVYPPGMKIMATWFKQGRGMAIGALVGALTIGVGMPHMLKLLGGPDWRQVMLMASALAVVGGLICLVYVKDGPYVSKSARFDWRYAFKALGNKSVRLANFGYLGHQWELYAVWTWGPFFLYESFKASGVADAVFWAGLGGFGFISIGSVGCVVGGVLADRYGRTTITIVSMTVSGACCLLVGLFFGGTPALLMGVCMVWGIAIIADSAQFSASITELADPAYLGTVLTLQTCLGFLLTLGSIRLMPILASWLGWQWVFSSLAIGPLLGIWAMYRLRFLPEAAKIGGEKGRMT